MKKYQYVAIYKSEITSDYPCSCTPLNRTNKISYLHAKLDPTKTNIIEHFKKESQTKTTGDYLLWTYKSTLLHIFKVSRKIF